MTCPSSALETRTKLCPVCGKDMTYEAFPYEYMAESIRSALKALEARIACQTCIWAAKEKSISAAKTMRAARARNQSYTSGWVPEDARGCTFKKSKSDYEVRDESIRQAFIWGREWTPGIEKPWAYVQGSVGTGKSYFARCLLNRAMGMGLVAYEVDAEQIQKWALGWVEGDKRIEQVMSADIVLVEEVGLCNWQEGGLRGLRRIVDNAYKNRKSLVFTSNVSKSELAKDWLDACAKNRSVYDSLRDRMRGFTAFEFVGASLRGKE